MSDGHNNQSSESGEIWIHDFTEQAAHEVREKILAAHKMSPTKPITLYIDSNGGDTAALFKIIDTMDSLSNKFITVAMGKAFSCGAILLSHGDFRFASAMSEIMFHDVSGFAYGTLGLVRARTKNLQDVSDKVMSLVAVNCGRTVEELIELVQRADGNELWMSPGEAVEMGLIDAVGVPIVEPEIAWSVRLAEDQYSDRFRQNAEALVAQLDEEEEEETESDSIPTPKKRSRKTSKKGKGKGK